MINTNNCDDYITYTTSTSSVTGERNDITDVTTVSGRPFISFVRGRVPSATFATTGPRILSGFDTTLYIIGKNFCTANLTCYLSATSGTYTNHLSAVSAFDLFSTYKYLSSVYPEFSGFEIPRVPLTYNEYTTNHGYHVHNDNTLQLNISATNDVGKIEVIIANHAGRTTLDLDYRDKVILVEGPNVGDPNTSVENTAIPGNLYWSNANIGATTVGTVNFEIQIFEINNNTDRNWVRTVLDHTGAITLNEISQLKGKQFLDTTLLFTKGSSTTKYYLIRGSHDGASILSYFSIHQSDPVGSNKYYVSQATNLSQFAAGLDTNAGTVENATPGTGFPAARYATSMAHFGGGGLQEFQVSLEHEKPLWMWFQMSSNQT